MEETTTRKEKSQKKDTKKKGGFASILTNLKTEFNRIIWPDKESLTKRTIAVLVSSVALGGIIALIDMVVKFGLGFVIS
ncbi:MAG: preprotein translocase subunit SecE [Lachnospiraceae bacterium]|nr:preprotein translocase subunit SecE [Lachnospiraceae bacterium]